MKRRGFFGALAGLLSAPAVAPVIEKLAAWGPTAPVASKLFSWKQVYVEATIPASKEMIEYVNRSQRVLAAIMDAQMTAAKDSLSMDLYRDEEPEHEADAPNGSWGLWEEDDE